MRKHNLFTWGIVLGSILISGNSFGDNGHYIVRLKGNVLYPGYTHKNMDTHKLITNNHSPAVNQVAKKNVAKQPAQLRIVKQVVQPSVVKQVVQPEVAVQKVENSNSRKVSGNTMASSTNYEQRQSEIHSCIFGILPGTYLDSMRIINHLLNDSIRNNLCENYGTDNNPGNLNLCLNNSIRDSIVLSRLNTLLFVGGQEKSGSNGVLIAHCNDVSSSSAIDSVEMDVFSGGTLVASGISGKNGTIEARDVPVGNYYAIFSKKDYATVSFMHVKVTTTGQSYVDVPLNKQVGALSPMVAKNAWFFIITWGIILLLTIIILAYRLARYTEKRSLIKQFKVNSPVM